MHRGPSHAIASRQSFAVARATEPEHRASGTLLPWADPYIADLHRRHEGELRRERVADHERE